MNEVEASKHANELLRRVVESLGEILPSGNGPPTYDNIGAQLGQAVSESIEKEVALHMGDSGSYRLAFWSDPVERPPFYLEEDE